MMAFLVRRVLCGSFIIIIIIIITTIIIIIYISGLQSTAVVVQS